ncbi:MAG: glycosyltransferase, partial [Anaerolineae bacterium]|nr:glycosyltransferase [Anaerolineae bacterium]NIQ83147.1 glycosyltransferase [Anaerolineae bacterium]
MSTDAVPDDRLAVFYVEPIGGHRGMHYYDFELCGALQELGIEVTLLTCDETRSTSIPGSIQVRFPFRGIYGDAPKVVRGVRYLRALIDIGLSMRQRRVPLAHFHFFHFPPVDYVYLKWIRLLGARVVLTVHDVVPFDIARAGLSWLGRLYHEADRIIIHAEANRGAIVDKFGVRSSLIRVIPMGPYLGFADANRLPASLAKGHLGVEPHVPVILFFGQVKKVKGLQYLIRAFGQALSKCPTARLVIAGPVWKDSFASYADLIHDLDLDDAVLT